MHIVKNFSFFFLMVIAVIFIGMHLSTETALAQVSGNIERVWVDHNVYKNDQKGMRIHVKFTARNMRNAEGRLTAYFYFESGAALKDYNGKFKTKEKNVSVGWNFTPQEATAVYNDFTLFIPYSELHLKAGRKYWLKFNVVASHTLSVGYSEFGRSNGHLFTYSEGAPIRNLANPAKCLHKDNSGWNNGNPVHLWDCNAGTKEFKAWFFDARTGYIHSAFNPSQCLHKKHGGWNNGNPVHLWDCNAGAKEFKTWQIDTQNGFIRSAVNPQKCIHKDHGGWNNGNPIHLWDCHAGTKEFKTWQF
jgi:hypothetical protein